MSIGLPYKGSKSEIAEELVAKLPPCGKILDACCGGGAVLVALAQSLKYKSVVGNDRNPATIALLDAVLINKGQIEYEHPEPCSRNDFFVSLQRIENGDLKNIEYARKHHPKIYAAIMEKHGLKEMLEKVGIEQKGQLSLF